MGSTSHREEYVVTVNEAPISRRVILRAVIWGSMLLAVLITASAGLILWAQDKSVAPALLWFVPIWFGVAGLVFWTIKPWIPPKVAAEPPA